MQNADDACDRAGLRMGDLELQIKELKGRQAEQLHLMQQQHSRCTFIDQLWLPAA